MTGMSVTVDSRRFTDMTRRIQARTDDVDGVVERTAARALAGAVFTHEDQTGELRRSVRVQRRGDARYAVVSEGVDYARFVFSGTRYMDARPPDVRVDAGELARDLAREVFGQ